MMSRDKSSQKNCKKIIQSLRYQNCKDFSWILQNSEHGLTDVIGPRLTPLEYYIYCGHYTDESYIGKNSKLRRGIRASLATVIYGKRICRPVYYLGRRG